MNAKRAINYLVCFCALLFLASGVLAAIASLNPVPPIEQLAF